jgi:hypothetical protein
MTATKSADVLQMSPKTTNAVEIEIIDAGELARRWGVPKSWVAQHTTARYPWKSESPA